MTDLTRTATHVRSWPLPAATVLSAGALTLLFAHTLAAYWHFYHLGSPGTGLFIALLVLPGGFVVSINIIFFVARALMRRGSALGRAVALGSVTVGAVFVLLLTLEIW